MLARSAADFGTPRNVTSGVASASPSLSALCTSLRTQHHAVINIKIVMSKSTPTWAPHASDTNNRGTVESSHRGARGVLIHTSGNIFRMRLHTVSTFEFAIFSVSGSISARHILQSMSHICTNNHRHEQLQYLFVRFFVCVGVYVRDRWFRGPSLAQRGSPLQHPLKLIQPTVIIPTCATRSP